MNGASALIQTLADCGVELCIANPGTSEMHLVQALDGVPQIRSVLALFEGVCTGAADGYGRMMGKPAMTALHLGPGLANGIANLHNARRANTPLINVIGNHPNYHVGFDAPLTSDIETLARNFSSWQRSCSTPTSLAQDGADAYTATLRQSPDSHGQIATLIMGADAAWGDSPGPVAANSLPHRSRVDDQAIEKIAKVLEGSEKAVMFLEDHALTPAALEAASRISNKTGCRLTSGTFPSRVDGGPGSVQIDRLPYFPEQVINLLEGTQNIILVGSKAPTSFFAYETTPSSLVPQGCQVDTLARIEEDAVEALQHLAERLGASNEAVTRFEQGEFAKPEGALNTRTLVTAIAANLPENAIVTTDSGGGGAAYPACQNSVPHTWLTLTGGAIGQGGPAATGAALACPDRKVYSLLGDGGAAYTIQCLWTQARENLDITTVIFANKSYNILNVEYGRLGVTDVGDIAASLFDIGNPELDWVSIAKGFGVPGAKADTAEEFSALLERRKTESGPFLIQANGELQR